MQKQTTMKPTTPTPPSGGLGGNSQEQTIETTVQALRARYPQITRLRIKYRKQGRKLVLTMNIGKSVFLAMYAHNLCRLRYEVKRCIEKNAILHPENYATA